MKYKKEYWKNLVIKDKRRNNIHIRLKGEDKSLCGLELNPEFDPEQEQKWENIDSRNAKKICKRCKKAAANLKDPRDENISKALKTYSNSTQQNYKVTNEEFIEKETEQTFEEKVLTLYDATQLEINEVYKLWDQNGRPEYLIKMSQLKELEKQLAQLCPKI